MMPQTRQYKVQLGCMLSYTILLYRVQGVSSLRSLAPCTCLYNVILVWLVGMFITLLVKLNIMGSIESSGIF
jgi:hypothetical protein